MNTKRSILMVSVLVALFLALTVTTVNAEITWKHNGTKYACHQHSMCEYAFGETWCSEVNGASATAVEHYTRARMEKKGLFGYVATDSGRQYGVGYSSATSPCADHELRACTYYGRD